MTTNDTPPLPMLPMHLMLTMGCWMSSPFALQCAKSVLPSLSGNPKKQLSAALQQAVSDEAQSRARNLLGGLLRYMDTPYAREVAEPACIWRRGNARLLDYGAGLRGGDAPLVLFVPSLINRYYILDLEENRSMLRFMADKGIYPLVLDWGAPGEHEQAFGCGDYITDILLAAVDFIYKVSRQRIVLAGYCMGGVLAMAAAQLRSRHIAALGLFATPWDFHCKELASLVLDRQWLPLVDSLLVSQDGVPADIIQSLFYLTDPFVFEQKFRRFADLPPDSRAARDFMELEYWVNDGVPMTSEVARDCLIGWAQENRLAAGRWRVAGKAIDPRKITMPVFLAIPRQDHVVPQACAQPLLDAMPHAQVVRPGAGHVGMIVGGRAKKELWQPFADWAFALHAAGAD
jgi:polyhydroxyalkanoate synthase